MQLKEQDDAVTRSLEGSHDPLVESRGSPTIVRTGPSDTSSEASTGVGGSEVAVRREGC
jgi:hypothetical protein